MCCEKPVEIFNKDIARERIDKRIDEGILLFWVIENCDYLRMK